VKYIDRDGDTWEDTEDGRLRIVTSRNPTDVGLTSDRAAAETRYGPLRPLTEGTAEPQDAPSPALPTVEGVLSRASVFQSAHALVTGLSWGEEKPTVYDVLSVAKWLEGDE
jgi:hypothetical protein